MSQKGASQPGIAILSRIFASSPELKVLFLVPESISGEALVDDPQFQKHAKVFTDTLQMCVESVSALDDSLGPLLVSYGSHHVAFERGDVGFKAEYWQLFADAMYHYGETWKVTAKQETLEAWRILVFFIVHKMRLGFQLEKARKATNTNDKTDEQ